MRRIRTISKRPQQRLTSVDWAKIRLSRIVHFITNIQIMEELNLEMEEINREAMLDTQNRSISKKNPSQGPLVAEPGSGLRTLGGFLLVLSIPVIMITYVIAYSPLAPSRYFKRLKGIDEAGEDLATFLLAVIMSLIISGLLLYSLGKYRQRRAAVTK